jgi:quinone-modifying oxidoreductase subunit QmoB
MAAAIEADANIKVYLNAITSKTAGSPGQFEVEISTESGPTVVEKVGAIIQATGFSLYDANNLPELGYGKSANVVDQAGLEALAKAARRYRQASALLLRFLLLDFGQAGDVFQGFQS